MPKWFDLGKDDARLRYYVDPNTRRSVLVLLGLAKDSVEWSILVDPRSGLNFKPSPTGKPMLVRPFTAKDRLKLLDLRKAFPDARMIEIPDPDEVSLKLNGAAKLSPQEIALAAAMRVASPIGLNALSQRVFETTTGERFVLDADGKRIAESQVGAQAFVLRANEQNLSACAQGFVISLMAGAHAAVSDVKRFVDVLYGSGRSEDLALVEKVSQAIEAEMASRLLERHQLAGDAAYKEAQALYENAPPHVGEAKGAGAVPLPVAVATQEIIRAFGGSDQMAVYVPRLFDGALAAMLGQNFVTLTDPVDPHSREGQMRTLVPSSVHLFEREPNESVAPHRVSILNVEDPSAEVLASLRADLDGRHANGMSVLLVPEFVGGTDENKGADRERLAKFVKELQNDYDVPGISIVSSVMRKKLGLNSGLMMVIVGRRFSPREKQLRGEDWVPRATNTVYDWDALRTFTNDVLVRVHEAAGRKLSAEEEAALRSNEGAENSYQLPYQSFSKNGEVELMIPRNLAGPTYRALQNLQDRVGDLDAYLRNTVKFSEEQYAYLAPEQVDAGALEIAAFDRGKGFLLGDQTGAGKGVTLALAVSYAWERGWPVVFVTKQDNLFSDFYRDIKKTGLHTKMRPLVLNHTAQVVDQFSENLDRVAAGVSRKEFLEKYRFGLSGFDNPNFVFATYSQFSSGEDSEKSDFIKAIAPEALVIFDEAHIAAGDSSKMGAVCTEVSDSCRAVAYSSATWLKDARQMRFYQRALPASVDAQMVADAMRTGGESIQEVFTAMLAQDGVFIRRERDASELQFDSVVDEARLSGNEAIANQVSVILQGLQRLCGVTDQVGRRLTKAQVDRLDAARQYIDAAIERAHTSVVAAREQARDALRRMEVPDEEEMEEAADDAAQAQEEAQSRAVQLVQQALDQQTAMREQAETENEDFLASGQSRTVFDADDVGLDAPLISELDIKLEDLGFSAQQAGQITADLDVLASGDRDGALERLEKEVKRIQRMVKNVSTRTTAFGSLLFTTQRTLNVSLQARFAAERAIEKIRAGQKPIIFLEQTFEQRLAEALESRDAVKNEDGTVSIKPITLKDNLREMYSAIVNISHTDAEGVRHEGTILDGEFMATDEEREVVREGLRTLDEMIDALPDDLYCSPIDTVCNAIRKAGYTVGEATGRKYHVVDMEDGVWKVALRKKSESKISYIERAFNFGEYDALVGNKAMSTGLSIHASKDFDDQRQRVMMFCQVFADINDYVQAIGRADRRGQIISPLIEMLASGLPSEARVMMNHYDKLRKLFASATSNRSSRFEQQELPDLFNRVGDMSVRDFLQANPGVATRLGIPFHAFMPTAIKPNGAEVEVETRGLATFTVSRLDLLPVNESRAVYQEIAYNFQEVVKELDEQGVNPLRTNVIDLTDAEAALVTAREDLLPALLNEDGVVDSVFDEAVELHTVSAQYRLSARTWEQTLADIEQSTRRMFFESRAVRARGDTPDFVPDMEVKSLYVSGGDKASGPLMSAIKIVPAGLRDRVSKMFDAHQLMMRSSDAARATAGVTELPEAIDPNAQVGNVPLDGRGNQSVTPAQVVERRKAWLLKNLQYFMPGQYVSVAYEGTSFSERQVYKGVVTDISLPPRGRETNLTRWAITLQMPGFTEPMRFTLQELYKATFVGMEQWLPAAETVNDGLFQRSVPSEFNSFSDLERRNQRYVLRGNLFRAASIAAENNIGAGGVLVLKNEPPIRVIGVRRGMSKHAIYAKVPVEISADDAKALFCSTWPALDRPDSKNRSYFVNFLRCSLESRGIHSAKEGADSALSIYWLPTRSSNLLAQIMDEVSDDERRAAHEEEETADAENHLLAGVGIRVNRVMVGPEKMQIFIAAVNAELGYEAVETHRGRPGSKSVRHVVRFRNQDGARDTPERVREKLAIVTRNAAQIFDTGRFYTHAPEMRLLALAVSAQSRERARAMRDAAEEARLMRAQMNRMHFAGEEVEDVEECEENEDAGEMPTMEG